MITHIPVSSSNVESVGYDGENQVLEAKFKHGGTYRYEGVPPQKYWALMAAPSIGKHLHQHIKGAHAHSKVPE
jgi:hypothetical protein